MNVGSKLRTLSSYTEIIEDVGTLLKPKFSTVRCLSIGSRIYGIAKETSPLDIYANLGKLIFTILCYALPIIFWVKLLSRPIFCMSLVYYCTNPNILKTRKFCISVDSYTKDKSGPIFSDAIALAVKLFKSSTEWSDVKCTEPSRYGTIYATHAATDIKCQIIFGTGVPVRNTQVIQCLFTKQPVCKFRVNWSQDTPQNINRPFIRFQVANWWFAFNRP